MKPKREEQISCDDVLESVRNVCLRLKRAIDINLTDFSVVISTSLITEELDK